jgi:hypothetical protein
MIRRFVRVGLTALLSCALMGGVAGVAGASGTSTTTISARATYKAEVRAIDAAFQASVATAQNTYKKAISPKVTAAQRASALAAYDSALVNAQLAYAKSVSVVGVSPSVSTAARAVLVAARAKALKTYRAATEIIVSSTDKLNAREALSMAIDNAATAREAAIAALGPEPAKAS